jgi:hypothetical protein
MVKMASERKEKLAKKLKTFDQNDLKDHVEMTSHGKGN